MIQIDPQPKLVYLSLCFRKPNLNTALMSSDFGVIVGTELLSFSPDYFCISSEKANLPNVLPKHFDWLFSLLERNEQLLKKYRENSVEIDLACYWVPKCDNTCPELDLATIKRLSRFELGIWFDIYLVESESC